MSRFLNGGYIMLDITDANLYNYASKAVNANKPVMVYDATGNPYYAKDIKLIGTTVAITTDNGIIAVASDGTVTTSKNITNIQITEKHNITSTLNIIDGEIQNFKDHNDISYNKRE